MAVRPSRSELERLLVEDNAALGRGASALERRRHGLGLLLGWLERAEGRSWQARWVQLGEPADWQAAAGAATKWQRLGMTAALTSLLCHRILQPSYHWLFGQRLQTLGALLFASTDRGEDARLVAAGRRAGMSATMLGQALSVLTYVLVHTGRRLDQLTSADLLAYGQARRVLGKPALGVAAACQLLYELGIVDQPAPTKGVGWRVGQRTMAELVDRYPIACRPVRDLLVRYLEERAPAMDYASLLALARRLVGLFWCDLERHHPGVSSLHLEAEVAAGWRRRALLRADGRPRRDAANLFTSVRAFYLDLAQWAAEDPASWSAWVAPCPVTPADLRRFAKAKHHQQAALHARIRTLAPALPTLVAATHQHLTAAGELLATASACRPGEMFVVGGRRYRRMTAQHGRTRGLHAPVLVKPLDEPPTRRAINCQAYEADAFWAWAIIEVLRLTGIRLEELLELTHLSIRHYRLAGGELVVLLQVAPSKTDRERVIPVCPELAHVLAMVVARARGHQPSVPLIERYDHYERLTSAPLPYLFQRRPNGTPVVIGHQGARDAITRASRPSREYREPTTQEWDGFQQHFRRRRMALGDCYRPYGTDCPHEHACVRLPDAAHGSRPAPPTAADRARHPPAARRGNGEGLGGRGDRTRGHPGPHRRQEGPAPADPVQQCGLDDPGVADAQPRSRLAHRRDRHAHAWWPALAGGQQGEPMPVSDNELEKAVALITHDLAATLDWDPRRAAAFAMDLPARASTAGTRRGAATQSGSPRMCSSTCTTTSSTRPGRPARCTHSIPSGSTASTSVPSGAAPRQGSTSRHWAR
jgi:hypothetical protein